MPRVLNYLKAMTASLSDGRGEARIRRGVRPWHARRGRPRHLGGPRLSSTHSGLAESRWSSPTHDAFAGARVVGHKA